MNATPPKTAALQRLADWVASVRTQDIPGSVRTRAVACLVDTLGVALAGSRTTAAEAALQFARQFSRSDARSQIIGARDALTPQHAAFVNGTAAHALDFDDNCYSGFVHGSAIIVPAALAVAQELNASGRSLITAIVVGSECEYAIGAATRNVLYDRGWWTTGVLGPVGSGAAAAHLLKLDAAQTAAALGLAVAGAGGMKACFGSDTKPLLAGRTAESGVVAAWLAGNGASGAVAAIETHAGFARLFNAGEFDHGKLGDLGRRWSLESPGIDVKRIPVCLSSHAAVDAVRDLVQEHDLGPEDIEHICCDVPPIVRNNLIYDRPSTVQQAQFSLHYAIAVALYAGDFKLEHLSLDLIEGGQLAPLMARVEMTSSDVWADADFVATAPEGAVVLLRLRDGRSFTKFRASAHGCAGSPLTPTELAAKFLECAAAAMGADEARALLDKLTGVEGLDSVCQLL